MAAAPAPAPAPTPTASSASSSFPEEASLVDGASSRVPAAPPWRTRNPGALGREREVEAAVEGGGGAGVLEDGCRVGRWDFGPPLPGPPLPGPPPPSPLAAAPWAVRAGGACACAHVPPPASSPPRATPRGVMPLPLPLPTPAPACSAARAGQPALSARLSSARASPALQLGKLCRPLSLRPLLLPLLLLLLLLLPSPSQARRK